MAQTKVDMRRDREQGIKKVLWLILVLNLAVASAKIIGGILSDSESMRADGVHSLFDSTGNIIGLIGIALAARPADDGHPYGHAKLETIASLVIGIMLLAAAYEVGGSALRSLLSGEGHAQVTPISFVVMCGTLFVNLCVTTYEHRQGRRFSSDILLADAKHTLSDVLVSASVIIGLIFVSLGFPLADPIAALLVTVAIFWTAISVFRSAHRTLSDVARIDPEQIAVHVQAIDGVVQCHRIRTRGSESEVHADLHILVDAEISIRDAHAIGDEVEVCIQTRFPQVKDVVVHLEPADSDQH